MSNIRFYKYYFNGMPKPIIMEAENRQDADKMLVQLSINSKVKMRVADLVDVRIESPIFGVSTRKRQGKQYVWVGTDKTPDGWLLQSEYDEITKNQQ